MEGADPNFTAGRQALDTETHFVGRLVREREGENLLPGHAIGQHSRNAVRDYPRLSAPRTGKDE